MSDDWVSVTVGKRKEGGTPTWSSGGGGCVSHLQVHSTSFDFSGFICMIYKFGLIYTPQKEICDGLKVNRGSYVVTFNPSQFSI